MNGHSSSNKSWKTTSLCSQSMFSAPFALFVVPAHLGLFHTRRYRPISLYRNWLCRNPQAKKGPQRPTFSRHLVFCHVPFSASSAFSSVNLSPTCGKEFLATAGGQRCREYRTIEGAEIAESSHLPFAPPAGRLPYALRVHLRSSAVNPSSDRMVTLNRMIFLTKTRDFPILNWLHSRR